MIRHANESHDGGFDVVALTAGAQDSWTAHTNVGEYAFARGDLERAESEFRAALEIAQRLPAGDRRLETSLQNLARLYEHESDFDRAQPLYQLLLAAKEHRLGTEHPDLLNVAEKKPQTAQRALKMHESPVHAPDGPLWYRGNVVCSELIEADKLAGVLEAIDADRVVIGHTPTPGRQVLERLDGGSIVIDTCIRDRE